MVVVDLFDAGLTGGALSVSSFCTRYIPPTYPLSLHILYLFNRSSLLDSGGRTVRRARAVHAGDGAAQRADARRRRGGAVQLDSIKTPVLKAPVVSALETIIS